MGLLNQTKAAAAGVAGAIALTALHETGRRLTPEAPRLDVLGMRGLSRVFDLDLSDELHDFTLAADLAANGIYYGLVGLFSPRHALTAGTLLGLAAGIGSIVIPPRLGLGWDATNRSTQTQIASIALYAAGGAVAGLVYSALNPATSEA
jgi:hypothetical protein